MLPMVLAALGAVNRRRVARVVEAEYVGRYPPGRDGAVAGAEGFRLEGTNGRALLLLHGSGDTPQTLRHLAERLHADGYTVHAPLLPGHGRSPRSFATTGADEYLTAAREALDELRSATSWVAIVGLSMGGALGAQLATKTPDLRALVLLAPYLVPPMMVRALARTSRVWGMATAYLRGRGTASVHDPAARPGSRAYGTFSPGALRALVATADAGRRALPRLTLPVLVVNSEQDNRIPPPLAREALRTLRTLRTPTESHWVSGCGHVITVDYCKDVVAELVRAFLARQAD